MTIPEIARRLSAHFALAVCQELLPAGKQIGSEWRVGDYLNAPGDELAIQLDGPNAGLWHDPDTGVDRDILHLIAASKTVSPRKAAEWAVDQYHLEDNASPEVKNGHFDPLTIGFKEKHETVWRKPIDFWTYYDAAGKELGWTLLYENPTKFMAATSVDGGGKLGGWKRPAKKPIYNLHLLSKRPNATVLIVGSERAAVAGSRLFPDAVCISWMGGPGTVSSVDWKPVDDRELVIWPDKNNPGREAMTWLKAKFPFARVVDVSSLPENWDLESKAPKGISFTALFDAAGDLPTAPEPVELPCPFRCLGEDEAGFYYHSYLSGYVVHLPAEKHSEMTLQLIASDDYWEHQGFLKPKSPGVDYKAAAKFLIQQQRIAGRFNPANVRGLGCWLEGDDIIYHAGDRLYVNGVEKAFRDHSSKFIYPSRPPIGINLSAKATPEDGLKFSTLCSLLPWSAGQMTWILPAMCFIAPICGALSWRPSLWLTGAPGSGKSWTYGNILAPLFGEAVVKALSATTEAGLRQTLQCDALPVIADEVESKDERSQARIQSLLELVRQSSSETGGAILKGHSDGHSRAYKIRSCFIFLSIVTSAIEPADESRFARLDYVKREDQSKFNEMVALCASTLQSQSWCDALRSRAIHLAPLIRQATITLQKAITAAAKDARKGQQYGTLAAGYWMLTSDTPPTPEQAAEWALTQNWSPIGAGDEHDEDPHRVIATILQTRTTLQDGDAHRHDATVSELLEIYYKERGGKRDSYFKALMRLGIHPMHDVVDVAHRHPELSRIFKGTPYAGRWRDHLARLSVTDDDKDVVFKLFGCSTRGVRIPLNQFLDIQQPDLPVTDA